MNPTPHPSPNTATAATAPAPKKTPESTTDESRCHECNKPDNKMWLCRCAGCAKTFHYKCIPKRTSPFIEVLCYDCVHPDRQLEIIRRLRRENQLLRDEHKLSEALITLYQEQCEHYKEALDHVDQVLHVADEESEVKPAVPEKE